MTLEFFLPFFGIMLFVYWLNYCMGSPLADDVKHVDVDSIFFFFPYMLAVRKLKKYHLWNDIDEEWRREINVTHGSKSKLQARRDHMREVFATGREFFTWERGLLCPVCFHFWLTLFVWALFIQDAILISALFYLANHFLIRKIS